MRCPHLAVWSAGSASVCRLWFTISHFIIHGPGIVVSNSSVSCKRYQDTKPSLTNRATHFCKCNSVADPPKSTPIPSHMCHRMADPRNTTFPTCYVAVWCSDNALVLINVVALHRARLVLGLVTAFGKVNYLTT